MPPSTIPPDRAAFLDRAATLARNFGQHPATIVGILHSSGTGDHDEDLQHCPEVIATLLRKAKHADTVYANPARRAIRDGDA